MQSIADQDDSGLGGASSWRGRSASTSASTRTRPGSQSRPAAAIVHEEVRHEEDDLLLRR
jgi:hypothetical protein